ncbi:RNA-binding protein with multiple splicing 2 [Saguinus oedipus]|uniref:RNA-binding protein with multiple splicing 2 n=1 Tax=Saguinus oedipus TaxID=9490 RepID=A0ABQ9W570_SAGOE|nr:RNA-binding protein with multiple splicing 2 [Saguinus oedipus]
MAKSKLVATPNPTNVYSALGGHFIAWNPYDLMGAALIPASPETWDPYPLYNTELTPVIPQAAFTYPAATAAAAALHAQVPWYLSSDTTQQRWKYPTFCWFFSLVTMEWVLGISGGAWTGALSSHCPQEAYAELLLYQRL